MRSFVILFRVTSFLSVRLCEEERSQKEGLLNLLNDFRLLSNKFP